MLAAGLDRSGLIGIWAQLAVLLLTVMPAFGPANWLLHAGLGHARLLLAGVVLSRWGLWSFDLAVTQMMQERVASSQLGTAQRPVSFAKALWAPLACPFAFVYVCLPAWWMVETRCWPSLGQQGV